MNHYKIPQFVKSFGESFFCYTLNLSSSDTKMLLNDAYELCTEKERVLKEIIEFCRQRRLSAINQIDVDYEVYENLKSGFIQKEHHLLNHWRLQSGGSLFQIISNENKLIDLFKTLAVEYYPVFLISNNSKFPTYNLSIGEKHKQGLELARLLLDDPDVSTIFAVDKIYLLHSGGYIQSSSGTGGTINLGSFMDSVFINSYYLLLLKGKSGIDEYLKCVEENVKLIKGLLSKDIKQIPFFLGYSNIRFPKCFELIIPQGVIYTFESDKESQLPMGDGPKSVTSQEAKIVFESKVNFDFLLKPEDKTSENRVFKMYDDLWERIQNLDEEVRLCITLSCDREIPVSAIKQWTIIFDPFVTNLSCSWSSKRRYPSPFYDFTEVDIPKVQNWCSKISNSNTTNIRIAIKRVLSSLIERDNPIDSFIDSAIALENLFGGPSELTLRISTSVAYLLGNDTKSRIEIQSKIKKLYNDRSKIVHGESKSDLNQIMKNRDYSIAVCLKSISILFNYPELLKCNSGERSQKLILGVFEKNNDR